MARPNKGLGHVDALAGDPDHKWTLRLILSTILGELSVDEACNELSIGPTYLGMLRTRVLQGALAALAPRPVGRPPSADEPSEREIEAVQRAAELEQEIKVLRAQLELAELKQQRGARRSKSPARRAPRQAPPT